MIPTPIHPLPIMENQYKAYDLNGRRKKKTFTEVISVTHKLPMPAPLMERPKDDH